MLINIVNNFYKFKIISVTINKMFLLFIKNNNIYICKIFKVVNNIF